MLSLKNNIYIAPTEDPTTQDYCYYEVSLVDYGSTASNIGRLVPIFYGKLYKNPIKKNVNGVDHYFYTTINDIIRPYFNKEVLNQSTNDYNYSDKGSNILCFRVKFSLLSGLYPVISDILYANVVDIHSFWGDANIVLNDNAITSWNDAISIDNSLIYYPSSGKYNHYVDLGSSRYFNINFGYLIPLHFYRNVFAQEDDSTDKLKNWRIELSFYAYNEFYHLDKVLSAPITFDPFGSFSGGAPRFCCNVGYLYSNIKYSVETEIGGTIDNLDGFLIKDMKILFKGTAFGSNEEKTLSEIVLPFSTTGCVPVNVKSGNTIYKATFIDNIGNLNSITFEGHYKEASSFEKETYFNENFEEKTNTITATDELVLNTGWLTENRTKEVQQLFSSKDIVLTKTVFGNNTYVSSTYKVLSAKNSSTEYKYLSDKKLSNLEITLTLNKKRII